MLELGMAVVGRDYGRIGKNIIVIIFTMSGFQQVHQSTRVDHIGEQEEAEGDHEEDGRGRWTAGERTCHLRGASTGARRHHGDACRGVVCAVRGALNKW